MAAGPLSPRQWRTVCVRHRLTLGPAFVIASGRGSLRAIVPADGTVDSMADQGTTAT
jgi:hypothetical protein